MKITTFILILPEKLKTYGKKGGKYFKKI